MKEPSKEGAHVFDISDKYGGIFLKVKVIFFLHFKIVLCFFKRIQWKSLVIAQASRIKVNFGIIESGFSLPKLYEFDEIL